MSQVIIPFTPFWFKWRSIFRSKSYFQERLYEALMNVPEVRTISQLTVSYVSRGFMKPGEVVLTGNAADEREKKAAGETVLREAAGCCGMQNNITVKAGVQK